MSLGQPMMHMSRVKYKGELESWDEKQLTGICWGKSVMHREKEKCTAVDKKLCRSQESDQCKTGMKLIVLRMNGKISSEMALCSQKIILLCNIDVF